MRRFADVFDLVDRTTSTTAKVAAMTAYFRTAPPGDAAWAVFFLTGRRLKRLVPWTALRDWTLEATGLAPWLLEDCYAVVGDGAETMALVLDQLPAAPSEPVSLSTWVDRIMELRRLDPAAQSARVQEWWRALDRRQRFVLLKLITGELRLGVSQPLVIRALSEASGLAVSIVASRLAGDWNPSPEWFGSVVSPVGTGSEDVSRPYPFYLASPLEQPVETLGDPAAWLVERKWDGIRAQLVRRGDATFLWSRGEELITHRFPEVVAAATHLPNGTVLDGEILAFSDGRPLPFSALQQRIGRQRQVAQLMRAVPVLYMAFDQIEHKGEDCRLEPLSARRTMLASLIEADGTLRVSSRVAGDSWEALAAERARSRALGVEGLMLKRLDSVYLVGRRRGDWWKWKIEPYTMDAVLIYAQPGSGKRASLLTDYTFGVWDAGALVPIAKAYSGLSNEEIAELDRWIRRHTVTRFGPVRHVEPVHVFELGFEAIARSSRHRSGIAVRFPRMLRWRKDKAPADADSLDRVRALLDGGGRG